jgi:hypothetical protein
MKLRASVLVALIAVTLLVRAEDKKPPAGGDKDAVSTLERRAKDAFDRGQYALAKGLYSRVAERVPDDKKRYAALQEQIRACDAKIKEQVAAMPVPPAAQPAPPQVEMSAEKRKKHVPPKPGEVYVTTIRELGNFEYDPDKGGNIPEDVKKLSGGKVRLQGFMIPLDQADNITRFSLVPSLFACCFGQPPQI